MKLRRLEMQGFRGVPGVAELRLNERSVCILAENGHGKTTIVDALELWSSGDIKQYHREGYGLDSVVNLDAPFALVMCETSEGEPLSRRVEAGGVSPVSAVGASKPRHAPPSRIPILRHRTMTDLMNKSPGDKRKELLELVGLAPLVEFRQALRTASNTAIRDASEAERFVRAERAGLRTLAGGGNVVERSEELRRQAGLATPISDEADLLALSFATLKTTGPPDAQASMAELARAYAAADDDVTREWNEAVRDPRAASGSALGGALGEAPK